MASTYLTRTQNGTVTNNKIATFSFWIKRSGISSYQDLVSAVSGGDYAQIQFTNSDTLSIFQRDSSSTTMQVVTTRVFRDTSAWSHILVALDTTQATASDRVKIYINGVQETSFSTATYPAQNLVLRLNTASHAQSVGAYSTSSNYIDGSMSHFHFVDGTAYAPTVFGETDATTGEWKINTSPSITMGNNGFTILKDGNTITDQSSNSNNFTLGGGTLTNTEDCPSNNFATLNPLIRSSNGTFASGNNKFTTSGGAWGSGFATLGMFNGQGKYYMEFKGASGTKIAYGISDFKSSGVIQRTEAGETRYCGEYANSYAYHYGGNFYYSGSSTSTGYDSFTSSNVIGMAVDMDNLKIYFHKDGNYQDSKNPASNNGYTIVAPEGVYLPTITVEDAGATVNFGNGVFDTTVISSEGTNASGIGKFEHDVPTGYTALSTKGLNL